MMNKKLHHKLFSRLLLLQAAWNYERMQNIGFAFVMQPLLERLYNGGELVKAVKRHLQMFNTQPYMASFVIGVVARLEEERASQEDEAKKEEITQKIFATKSLMSTATAAIGDPYFWGTLKPVALIILLWVCHFFGFWQWSMPESIVHVKLSPVLLVAVLFSALMYNLVVLDVRWYGIKKGYDNYHRSMLGLDYHNWQKIIRGIKYFGFIAIGMVVIGAFYTLSTYIETVGMRALIIPVAVILTVVLRKISMMYVYLIIIGMSILYFLLGGTL